MYTIEKDENEFEVEFEPVEGSAVVKIEGDKATVGYLSPDPESDVDWYFDGDPETKYFNIGDRDSKRFEPMDVEEIMDLVRRNPRRCFWVAKYEHSASRYYRTGEAITIKALKARQRPGTAPAAGGYIPDQEWDVSPGVGILVVPADAGKPYTKYCDVVLDAFTSWCNGDIYGVCEQEFVRDADGGWTAGESQHSWQYIGFAWATEALADQMGPEVAR